MNLAAAWLIVTFCAVQCVRNMSLIFPNVVFDVLQVVLVALAVASLLGALR